MQGHIKILGILHIVFGSLGVMFALGIMVVFGGIAGVIQATGSTTDSAVAAPVLVIIGGLVMIFILLVSVPGIIAGIGLLQFRRWARVLTIVISALDLLHVPFGTALGVYGLWVLLSVQGEALFQSTG
ncbi:MAG: hypothetical protein ABI165_10745 [Bryobacteraceae bacterium]